MGLAAELLSIMQCPSCGGSLTERSEPHRLVCDVCNLAYPVRDNVPVMLVDEASPDA